MPIGVLSSYPLQDNFKSNKKNWDLFFSLHPNLVAAAAHRTYRRSSVGGDFLQLQGGGGAAQVVDVGIIREGDETIGFYHLQGTGDALFPGIELLTDHLYATHISFQTAIGFLLHTLEKFRRCLEVDVLHSYLAIRYLILFTLHFRRLIVLETEGEGEGTDTFQIHIVAHGEHFYQHISHI